MENVIAFVVENKLVIVGFLFAASEVLALVPSIKSNSVFQLIYNGLKKIKEKLVG
jgi:hypothetical protein